MAGLGALGPHFRHAVSEGPSPLEAALGHTFADRSLLERALLHGSANIRGGAKNNERLEFLGDRVLGLAIAGALYRLHPHAPEGDLARLLNQLVRRETCAERASAIGIDEALRLGRSEQQGGGRKNTAILANACEAVLAAVHLDAGFAAAEAVVLRVWAPLLDLEPHDARDPKTALQEMLQARGEPPPRYTVTRRVGPDHAPFFTIVVEAESGVLATGQGKSKRAAEAEAAKAALEVLGA